MAPKAALRPFQMAALSASDFETREVCGVNFSAMAVIRPIRSAISASEPSTSTISSASTSSG